jgi:hypothetical protein
MPSVLRWSPRKGKKFRLIKCESKSEDVQGLDEIARVLVRFDHVASVIINANDGIM